MESINSFLKIKEKEIQKKIFHRFKFKTSFLTQLVSDFEVKKLANYDMSEILSQNLHQQEFSI